MAENFDKFSISIDADVSSLQSSLKAAENTLAQFESALKKATSIGEINYLNKNITNLNTTITQLKQQANQLGKPIGDASQSLINFSRIAQDAPYGIMGIANNLNPMVESFQRLAKTEGGTKKALQAMLSGLTGPAGIGVAIGIVSSLAVTFSKEIAAFFKGPTAELEKFRVELKKVQDEIFNLIGKEQTKRTIGISLVELITGGTPTQQEEALKKLKKLYGDSKAIQDLKLGQDKSYYTSLVNLAAKRGEAISYEQNYTNQLDLEFSKQKENEAKRNAELKRVAEDKVQFRVVGAGIFSKAEQIDAINKEYDALAKEITANISRLEALTYKALAKVTLTPTAESVKKSGAKTIDALDEFRKEQEFELHKQYLDRLKYQQLFKELDTSIIYTEGGKEAIQSRKESRKDRVKDVTAKDNSIGEFLAKDAAKRAREYQIEDDKVKALTASYENFANMLASGVTNGLMDVFTAIEEGKNPLDAVGQMFLNIAKNIAAAIIQATIFQAILTAFPELRAIFAASGVLKSAFGYSGPRATGGITNGPSMALVGEAGPEAIMPLSKLSNFLNTSFNAGAMSSGGTGNGSQFVLRGQDLLLSVNRAQKASNLKGQNISLG
jgi:hypothetical protein